MKPPIDPNYPTHTQRFHLRRQLIDELTETTFSRDSDLILGVTVKPTSWNWNKLSDDHNAVIVKDRYLNLERQLNSIIVKHHLRPCNQQKLIRSHIMVEKVTKDGHLTIPHGHGIIGVHPQSIFRFRRLLEGYEYDQNTQTESCTLSPKIMRQTTGIIHSIRFHEIYDLHGWLDYCTKQIETSGYPNGFRTGPTEFKTMAA
jgi:hypothetical protein